MTNEEALIAAILRPQEPREDIRCPTTLPGYPDYHHIGSDPECWSCREWLRGNIVPPEENFRATMRAGIRQTQPWYRRLRFWRWWL